MGVELNTVVQEVVIDDSKSAQGAARVVESMERMAAASDQATAANQRQASGFAALDAALKSSTPAQESALRRLDQWRAQADPVEGALQRLSRAELDLNRAISQGISTEQEKSRILDQLWNKLLGAAEAQEKLNAAMKAQNAQTAFNTQLGVKDDFNTAARAADIATYGKELDALRAKYNPLFAAQQQYLAQLGEIRNAVKISALTQAEGAVAIQNTKDVFAQQVTAIKDGNDKMIRGWGLNRTGMMELQAAGVNSFQALAAGMSPWRVAQMESAQVLGAFIQGVEGLGRLINPWTIGIVGVAAAYGLLAHAVSSVAQEQKQLQIVINASSNPLAMSTADIHGYIRELQSLGVSSADARDAVVGAIRSIEGASSRDLARATKDAADFAAAYNVPVQDAMKLLVDMSVNGYAAIKKLDDAYHFLSPSQAKMIAQLAEQGKQSQATAVAFGVLEQEIKGAAENSMTPMTRAANNLATAWSDLMDRIGKSHTAIGIVNGLADALSNPMLWNNLPLGLSAVFGESESDKATRHASNLGLGTSGGAHGPIVSRSSIAKEAAAGNPEAQKWIDEQTLAYQRQNNAMRASVGVRAAVQAGLEAEHTVLMKNGNVTQQAAAYQDAYNAAMERQAVAANDNIRAMALETSWTLKVAAAYSQGADAVIAVQAAMQADIAHSQDATINKQKLTAELIKQKNAQLSLQSAQELANEKLKTAADIEAVHIAQMTDPILQHAEEMRAERQAHLNELTLQYGKNIVEINKHMTEFDQQQMLEDQARYWSQVRQKAEGISADISTYLVDGITNAGQQGFKGFWDTAWAGAKRFIANLAAEFIKTQFIMPVVMSIVGTSGISSLLGIAGVGGGEIGGVGGLLGGVSGGGLLNGLSSVYNLLNGGGSSLLTGLGNQLIYSSLGQSLGLSSSIINMSHVATSGGLQMTGLGSGLSSVLGLLGGAGTGFGIGSIWSSLGLGTSVGSSVGGALGGAIGSIIPGVGTILGSLAGSALGGLFGNSQPSDKFANTLVDLSAGKIGTTQYNPSESDQSNISASQALAQQFLTLEQQILAITGGTAPDSAYAKVGSRDGIVVGVGNGALLNGPNRGLTATFANSEQGAQQALEFMIEALAKQISGVTDQNIQKVLAYGGTADELLANLQLVQTINGLTAANDDALVDALKAVNDQFDQLTAQARNLGIAMGALETERQKEIATVLAQAQATRAGYESQISGAAEQFFGANLTPLTNFRAQVLQSGSLSTMSPRDQYLAAQTAFRGLDLSTASASDLVSAGQAYLQQAQSYGASGDIRQQAFSEVNNVISARINQLEQTQAEAQASLGVTFKTSLDDQTAAFLTGLKDLADRLDAIKKAIAKAGIAA